MYLVVPVEKKGLTIGGFESPFFAFADLVAAYVLEKAEDLSNNTAFNGI